TRRPSRPPRGSALSEAILDAAGRALGARLEDPRLLKSWARNDVWRCRVAGGPSRLPPSLIVKRLKADDARGFHDWASLDFLTRVGAAPALAPRFLVGDAAARCFVVEDLGEGRTLGDALLGRDEKAASDALIGLAEATGRLHAATIEHHAEFDRARDALAPRQRTPLAAAVASLRAAEPRVSAWLDAVGASAPAGLRAALAALADRIEDARPFLAFTHGDMAPSNNHVSALGIRLLDFEYGGVRPAFYDTLLWNLFCPFPPDLIERVDQAYRAALTTGCAAARDDRLYAETRGVAVAWRMIDMLRWFGPETCDRDRPWAPGVSVRQALLWHFQRFAAVTVADALRPVAGARAPR